MNSNASSKKLPFMGYSTAPQSAGRPLASDHDRRWVYYRFVIPLEPEQQAPPLPKPPRILGPSPVPVP